MIREAFSFWTGHPFDFELWVRLGYSVAHGGNPYAPLPPVSDLSFAQVGGLHDKAEIAYLPLWPMITGLMYEVYVLIGSSNRFAYYFLLKQPIILGDVSLGYLLYRYVKVRNEKNATWTLLFWIFLPFAIIISAIWGMFDSIAMCFVMLSLVVADHFKSAFWTAMSIFTKSIPIIYALPLGFRKPPGWRWFTVSLVTPAALTMIVISVMGWPLSIVTNTLASTASKGGESMSAWDAFFYLANLGVLPSFSPIIYTILGLIWIPIILLLVLIASRKFQFWSDHGLVQSLLILTLGFLLFKARITEQYAIYLLAFAVLDVAIWNPERKRLLFATVAVALAYLITNNYFMTRFVSPVYPEWTEVESYLNGLIGGVRLAANLALGIAFTCLNAAYIIKILRAKPQMPVAR